MAGSADDTRKVATRVESRQRRDPDTLMAGPCHLELYVDLENSGLITSSPPTVAESRFVKTIGKAIWNARDIANTAIVHSKRRYLQIEMRFENATPPKAVTILEVFQERFVEFLRSQKPVQKHQISDFHTVFRILTHAHYYSTVNRIDSSSIPSPAPAPVAPDDQIDSRLLTAFRNLRAIQNLNTSDPVAKLTQVDQRLTELRQLIGHEIASIFNQFASVENPYDLETSKLMATLMDACAKSIRLGFQNYDTSGKLRLGSLRCNANGPKSRPRFELVEGAGPPFHTSRSIEPVVLIDAPADARRRTVNQRLGKKEQSPGFLID